MAVTVTPDPYSPVAEAERAARLAAATRLLDDVLSIGPILRRAIGRSVRDGVVRHLEGVACVLAERGWSQGRFIGDSGAVCLMQAVMEAAGRGFGSDETSVAADWCLLLMVQAQAGTGQWSLYGWNDAPGRTEAEVMQLVEDAIVFARSYRAVA